MKFNRTLKYASTVLLLLWLFMGFPEAEGARIAGEEDVTPSNPTLIQQRVIRPNPRTVPQRRPVPRTTVQSEEKTDPKGAATG